ncbi:hypothetical protein PHLCEN_2v3255, partial [Hermanssonia centrifuga]
MSKDGCKEKQISSPLTWSTLVFGICNITTSVPNTSILSLRTFLAGRLIAGLKAFMDFV